MTMDLFDLTNRTALVTGAAGGIGSVLARGLADAGADLVLTDRPGSPRLRTLADEITALGRRAFVAEQDLADTEQLAGFIDRVWREAGQLDILVNCAGIARLQRFNEITPCQWREILTTNVTAPFFLTQRTAEHMISAGVRGNILMMSSKNGLVAEAGLAPYNTSKGGMEQLTQSLALELGEHGITVNGLAPGVIDTEIAEDFDLDRSAFHDYYRQHIPLRNRFGSPDELVGAALLLVSGAGSYITGQRIVVDGGVLASQLPRTQFMPAYENTIDSGQSATGSED